MEKNTIFKILSLSYDVQGKMIFCILQSSYQNFNVNVNVSFPFQSKPTKSDDELKAQMMAAVRDMLLKSADFE